MSDILETASNWLERQRHLRRTRNIMYRRGEQSVPLLATIGRTQVEQSDEGGTVIETYVRDYLFRAKDLILGGLPTAPERGDRIEEAVPDGPTHIFEVLPLGDDPPWRYSDPYHETLRVHTKQIDLQEG